MFEAAMIDKKRINSCAAATLRKPRVVLTCGAAGGASGTVAAQFRDRDWDVFSVSASEDLACAVLARRPTAVVVPAETGLESGFLLAAKLRKAKPRVRIVLLAPNRTAEAERFAKFVGATLVAESDGTAGLVSAVTG